MTVPILTAPVPVYACPNCDARVRPDRMPDKPVVHPCRGMRLLMAPMYPESMVEARQVKVEPVAREDYEGRDIAQRDAEGNVVMAIEATRDEGTDRAVLVPTAVIHRDELPDGVFDRLTNGARP